jgi:hypothetical protein
VLVVFLKKSTWIPPMCPKTFQGRPSKIQNGRIMLPKKPLNRFGISKLKGQKPHPKNCLKSAQNGRV